MTDPERSMVTALPLQAGVPVLDEVSQAFRVGRVREQAPNTPNPFEVSPETFYAGLSETDSAAVQGFVGFVRTVNEPVQRDYALGGSVTEGNQFAVMAFGSSVAPKSGIDPRDIDLKILHPGQGMIERARAVNLIRLKIREHLLVGKVRFEETDYTYSYTGSVTHDRYRGTSFEGGYGKRNEDPSFRVKPRIGKPLHISISGDDRLPTPEHMEAERRGRRPFSLLTPEVL